MKTTPEQIIIDVMTKIQEISAGGAVDHDQLEDFSEVFDKDRGRELIIEFADNQPQLLEVLVQTTLTILPSPFSLMDAPRITAAVLTCSSLILIMAENTEDLAPFNDALKNIGDDPKESKND